MAPSSAPLDRTHPPEPGAAKDFHFPETVRLRNANGLGLLVARRADLPLFGLRYLNRAGAMFDPPDLAGLASFTGSLVDEGTKRRSAIELADQVEGLGGFLSSAGEWDGASVTVGGLTEHLEFGMELIGEVATQPAFDADEMERLRSLRLAEIDRILSDPAALAARALGRSIFGDHPYGHSMIGTAESIARMTRDDCVDFWESHRCNRGSFLVAAGAFDPDRLRELTEESFAELGDHQPPAIPDLHHQLAAATSVHVVDRPEAAQCELRVGHLGTARDRGDRAALVLMNSILGGKFMSRINLNLRERHGFTYGASSRFIERLGPGPFVISAAVDTAVVGRAVEEIVAEMTRLRDEPVGQEELDDSREFILGVFPYTLQTLQGLIARLEDIIVYDLPDDYFAKLPSELREVTVEDVQRTARELLHPDRLSIAVAGPSKEVGSQLERFGPVEVHEPRL